MQRKHFWLPAQGEVFLLDIPFYRTSGSEGEPLHCSNLRNWNFRVAVRPS